MSTSKEAAQPEDGHLLVFENAIEQHEPVALDIQGQMPSWLTGSLYRTGPGTFRVESKKAAGGRVDIRHWFDGLGMNHRFELLPGGRVEYRNHSTAQGMAQRIADAGEIRGVTFGEQDPCETLFHKFFTLFTPSPSGNGKDTDNVSVTLSPNMPGIASHTAEKNKAGIPATLIGKTDTTTLQVLDPETLDPLRLLSYAEIDPRLDGQMSAAHSCQDPETKEFFNFSLLLGPTPTYKVFKITPGAGGGKDFSVDILATIKDAPPAYLHSFSLTKKYVILCVWQADFSLSGVGIVLNRSVTRSLKPWNARRDAIFYVIDRHAGGLVARFTSPPFFAFHQINSFDSGADDVTIDLAVYEDWSVLEMLHLDHLRTLSDDSKERPRTSRPQRFVLRDVRGGAPGKARQAEVAFTLDERYNAELPTIHPALYYKPYRYTYGINKAYPSALSFADTIIKIDMANPGAEPKTWGSANSVPGEPIFVPRPGSTDEDDGVVVSVVLDADARRSMLVVLDAKDLTEVARAEMRTHVPLGFHGAWFGA